MGDMDFCLRWVCPKCGQKMHADVNDIREHRDSGQCKAMQDAQLAARKRAEVESARLLRQWRRDDARERQTWALEKLAERSTYSESSPAPSFPFFGWFGFFALLSLLSLAQWYR